MSESNGARLNRVFAARVLAEALLYGTKEAASNNRLSDRTVQRWLKFMEGDPELALAVEKNLRPLQKDWTKVAVRFLHKAIRKLERLVEEAGVEQMRDVTGAIHIIGNLDVAKEGLRVGLPIEDHPEGPSAAAVPRPDGAGAASEYPTPLH